MSVQNNVATVEYTHKRYNGLMEYIHCTKTPFPQSVLIAALFSFPFRIHSFTRLERAGVNVAGLSVVRYPGFRRRLQVACGLVGLAFPDAVVLA